MQLSSLKKRGTLRGPLFITFLGKFRVVVRVVSCRKKAHFTFDFPQVTCVYINKKVRIYVICRKYVLLKNGADGNRTPVRKSIPCSSTIIVLYLTFPLPSEKGHPDGFSSFIIRPYAQSFAYVVSHIVDARVLKCGCSKSDSCH